MKALLLWYPSDGENLIPDCGKTSQEAILSDDLTDEEKERICEVLEMVKSVPELLTY